MKYSDRLTLEEYRIATCGELDIEAIALQSKCRDDIIAAKRALREIDRMKLAGTYDDERARLAEFLDEPAFPELPDQAREDVSALTNFLAGLNSPDVIQRELFRHLYDRGGLSEKSLGEALHILRPLQAAKHRKGAKQLVPPWRNVAEALDEMRLDVAAGRSIPEAARRAARAETGGAENRAGTLERHYRARMSLRE